jgi:hypothetical protein
LRPDGRANVLASDLILSEKRRLEAARALATEPKPLLLDEVLTGLTPIEAQTGVELVRRVRTTVTVLMVEHVVEMCDAKVDRAIARSGKVLVEGKPADVVRGAWKVITASGGPSCCRCMKSPPPSGAGRDLGGFDRRRQGRDRLASPALSGPWQVDAAGTDRRCRAAALRLRDADGARIDGLAQHVITSRGIAYAPENRRLFHGLVRDNLRSAATSIAARPTRGAAGSGVPVVPAAVGALSNAPKR